MLGKQISEARKKRRFLIRDMAHRTGKNPARISEFENGKSNSTIDFLDQMGAALGMTLMFVPNEKVEEVLALVFPENRQSPPAYTMPSVFDEVFIDDSEDNDGDIHANR
jgi:transcriptional regulator with XRE-family HTH domain